MNIEALKSVRENFKMGYVLSFAEAMLIQQAIDAALQSGNSAQPVTVHAGYVLVPVEPTDLMVEAMYRHPLSMRGALKAAIAAAPKMPDSQLTPAPEDRLQKAIIDACIVFLHGCDSLIKNYECDFSDSETELYFCIANVAKKIGVVEETGNRRWSLSQQMRGEIEEVYRKYAMCIMEAAPKAK